MMELVFQNSIPNIWSKQAYVKVFDCKCITLKKAVNIFERMEIGKYIYKGVVESSNKETTRVDENHTGHSRLNRGESS